MEDLKLDYKCSGCGLHCLECLCEYPTYPADPCHECSEKSKDFEGKMKCSYCDNPAEIKLAVCMKKPCLPKNFQRLLYYEALMWTSPEKPKGVEPPERFRDKKPWWKRMLRR